MGPVLSADLPGLHQAEIALVDELSRLQRVIRALASHVRARNRAQLRMDERGQFLERSVVALTPGVKQGGESDGLNTSGPKAAVRHILGANCVDCTRRKAQGREYRRGSVGA